MLKSFLISLVPAAWFP